MFKDILVQLRLENKMTQTELANKIGVVKGTIANYESGLRKPDNDKLIALSEVFGVSVDFLLGLENLNNTQYKKRFEHSLGVMNFAQTIKSKTEPTVLSYSGNERIDSIVKEILKADLTEDDLKLIEFIIDKYKK